MKPILAIDFDGVICDSLTECLLTAYEAWLVACGRSPAEAAAPTPSEALARDFRQFRYLVRPAGEFGLLMRLLLDDKAESLPDAFFHDREAHAPQIAAFEPCFFAARERRRQRDPEGWFALHRQYPQFADAWRGEKHAKAAYLVTTKDLASVRLFNERWRLGFPDDRLYTKERFASKPDAMRTIAAREGRRLDDILFIDDHPEHLRDVAWLGVRCFWAAWGFTPEELGRACREAEPVDALNALPEWRD